MPCARRIDEAAALLAAARRPVILADVEIHRFGLQDELLAPGRVDRHADRHDASWARA